MHFSKEAMMQTYKIETVEAFKILYSERKNTVDYLEKFGDKFDKNLAMLIKQIAEASNV